MFCLTDAVQQFREGRVEGNLNLCETKPTVVEQASSRRVYERMVICAYIQYHICRFMYIKKKQ